jgi:hypothetical protein
MIFYARTSWYGLMYLLVVRGSLIPRILPMAILGGLMSALTCTGIFDRLIGVTEILSHPYSFQVYGTVFGSLSVSRLTIAYNRHWEGVTQVKVMYSKFTDACQLILSFDSLVRAYPISPMLHALSAHSSRRGAEGRVPGAELASERAYCRPRTTAACTRSRSVTTW